VHGREDRPTFLSGNERDTYGQDLEVKKFKNKYGEIV